MKYSPEVKYRPGQLLVAKGVVFECEDAAGCKDVDPISTEAEQIWKVVEDVTVDIPVSEDFNTEDIKEWTFGDAADIIEGELVKTEDGTAMLECIDEELCKSIPPDATAEEIEGVW